MTKSRIALLKAIQDELRAFAGEVDPPRVLLLADDSSLSIRANEAGLLRFALELMEVSAGGQVSASASDWLSADWLPLEAITLDPDPRLEKVRHSFTSSLVFVIFGIAIVIVFMTGLIVSGNWLGHLFSVMLQRLSH